MSLEQLRRDYALGRLDLDDVADDPIDQFRVWLDQALAAELPEPNAMTLATVDSAGRPNARIVLLKGLDLRGFAFYTNFDSVKGAELAAAPEAALVFHWQQLERQVRIRGEVGPVADDEADRYFASRPRASQLGAHASAQSRELDSRATLEQAYEAAAERFGEGEVPRPANWGGFRVRPREIEFWQGRSSRLHDRIGYVREADGAWRRTRLSP